MSLLDWLGVTVAGETPRVGDAAPVATSHDQQGRPVDLADLYDDGFTLVYFYPKASTPGCTAQACSLRDGFAQLQQRGVRVVGVSSDGPEAQRRFAQNHELPFQLLADEDHAVAKAFGVRLIFGMPMRQAFLIQAGRVVWRDLNASTREQARDVINFLEKRDGSI